MSKNDVMSMAAGVALLVAGTAAQGAWTPERTSTTTHVGRTLEYYRHGSDPAWGAKDPKQTDAFAVMWPRSGARRDAPLYVVLHSAGHALQSCLDCLKTPHNHDIYTPPDDFYALFVDCAANRRTDWWWGQDAPGFAETPVERRVMDTVRWTIAQYGIDSNRVYLSGNSMGGSGTLGLGLRHGDVFAAIKANVPAGVIHCSARMGFGPEPTDAAAKAAWNRAIAALPEPPVLVDYSAPNDGWSKGHENLYAALARRRYQVFGFWGNYGHANNDLNMAKFNDIIHSFAWTNVVRNAAYPVFTAAASDTKIDFKFGAGATKAPGQVNGFFRWRNLRDEPDSIALELRVVTADELKSKFFTPPASVEAEVALRRLQHFPVKPGERVYWTFGQEKGEAIVGADGLLSVGRLTVTAAPKVLTVGKTADGLSGLPKVLIIGDSISLGYTPLVKEKLKGVAEVSRPPCNCGPSQFVLRSMKNRDWAGGAHWDVIHVNFGIWDNHYLTGSSGSLDCAQLYRETITNASPVAVGTAVRDLGYRIRTPVKAYERNLRAILAYLMTRADRVVFALTTPLTGFEGDDRCGRIRVYNELAADVCRELGVEVDDLYSVAERHLDQQVDGCHFSPAGYALLADAVAASVRTALNGGSGAPRRLLTLTTGRGNARNGEGDLIWLKDGSILFVYGEWTDDLQLDEAQAHIVARRSSDHGRTWTPAREVFPREGRQNDMSVSLLRLADGRLALFCLRKNSDADCMPVVRFSSDEAKTWSAPVDCMPEAERDFYVLNNARVIQLKSGRILAPLAKHSPKDDNPLAGRLSCVFSDDGGRTWRKGRECPVFKPDGKRVTVQEPGVIELKDGRVYMYVRTGEGRQWQAFSKDGGETWTDFGPSPLFGPLAPATIRRAPDGRLLAVWNDHEGHPEYVHRGGWGRVPLTLAFSSDEGKTWKDKRVIEPDLEGFNCYIATLFDGDDLLLHYYCNQPGLTDSCVTRVPRALK